MSKNLKRLKKITPFKYPLRKHVRSQVPPLFSDYRRYKPFLQKEFSNKCVYCRKADSLEDKGGFHVEHYRPKNQFPDLEVKYANLFYSCAACNRYKGTYWSDNPSRQITNPCDDVMSHHLKFEEATITSQSEKGSHTIEMLQLNNQNSLQYRVRVRGLIVRFLKLLDVVDPTPRRNEVLETVDLLAMIIGEDVNKIRKVLGVS